MYVCIVASAQALPDIEELSLLAPDATICLYNLKLDILRGGELDAPAFPSKEFRNRFLSRVKPVYSSVFAFDAPAAIHNELSRCIHHGVR